MYKVARATTWEQVEEAASIAKRCIHPADEPSQIFAGTNWTKAKETWDKLGDRVIYFIVKTTSYPNDIAGYVRVFNTSSSFNQDNPTWVIDYMWPSSPESAIRVADELPGNVFVKGFFTNEPLTRHWPKLNLSLSVPNVPYRVSSEKVADWLLVMR